jgi:hypothetical protein
MKNPSTNNLQNTKNLFLVVEEEKDEGKKKELKEQLDEKLSKAKRRSLGNIRYLS